MAQNRRTSEAAPYRTAIREVRLGGLGFGELVRASRAQDMTAGAAERADALFGTSILPSCAEIF